MYFRHLRAVIKCLIGIREFTHGSHRCFRDDEQVNRWIDESEDGAKVKLGPLKGQIGLFAFPDQSNMRGRWLVCKRAFFSPYAHYFAKPLRPAKQKGAKILC